MAKFFVNRPIVAIVMSIIMVLLGVVAMQGLPIAQYPEIVPPMIQVTTTFIGASAGDVEASVATPLEQQINGVENMIYMKSTNANDGTFLCLPHHRVGALERGRVGQQCVHQEVPLVLFGNKSGRDVAPQDDDHVTEHPDEGEASKHLPRQDARKAHVPIGDVTEDLIEAVVERCEQGLLAGGLLEQHRRKRGAQREGVDHRKQHRDRNRDRELLVEASGDAAHETHGDEHRAQDEADRNDRARHFLHRLDRGFLRLHAVLDVVHHRLNDDDRHRLRRCRWPARGRAARAR